MGFSIITSEAQANQDLKEAKNWANYRLKNYVRGNIYWEKEFQANEPDAPQQVHIIYMMDMTEVGGTYWANIQSELNDRIVDPHTVANVIDNKQQTIGEYETL